MGGKYWKGSDTTKKGGEGLKREKRTGEGGNGWRGREGLERE